MGHIIYSCKVDRDDLAKIVDPKNKRVPRNFQNALLHIVKAKGISLERPSVIHNPFKKKPEKKVYWMIEIKQKFERPGFLDETNNKGEFTIQMWHEDNRAPGPEEKGMLNLSCDITSVEELLNFIDVITALAKRGLLKIEGGLGAFNKCIENRASGISRVKGVPDDPRKWTPGLIRTIEFIVNIRLIVVR